MSFKIIYNGKFLSCQYTNLKKVNIQFVSKYAFEDGQYRLEYLRKRINQMEEYKKEKKWGVDWEVNIKNTLEEMKLVKDLEFETSFQAKQFLVANSNLGEAVYKVLTLNEAALDRVIHKGKYSFKRFKLVGKGITLPLLSQFIIEEIP